MIDVVAGLLVRDGKVLLVQRRPNATVPEWSEAWCLPGGKVEADEDLEDALPREWEEEVTVRPWRWHTYPIHTAVYRTPGFTPAYRVHVFLLTDLYGEPRLRPEGGQAMEWVPLEEVSQRRCLPSTGAAIQAYLNMHPEDRR